MQDLVVQSFIKNNKLFKNLFDDKLIIVNGKELNNFSFTDYYNKLSEEKVNTNIQIYAPFFKNNKKTTRLKINRFFSANDNLNNYTYAFALFANDFKKK